MVAFKKIAAVLALTACQTNIVQAQPLDRGNDDPDASLTLLSSIPDDSSPSLHLHERNYDDVNAAISEFFQKKMPLPALCVGVYFTAKGLAVTFTTPEQRSAAYACIARQLNRVLPAGRQVSGEDVEMGAQTTSAGVDQIAATVTGQSPPNRNQKEKI